MQFQVIPFILLSVVVHKSAQFSDQCRLREFPSQQRPVYTDNVLPKIDETFLVNLIAVSWSTTFCKRMCVFIVYPHNE